LDANPELQEQIEHTKAFLEAQEPELDEEIFRLKSEGHLDRRSTSKIRTALDDARVSMAGVAAGMHKGEPVDGWTARMIAYELGMAADTLAHQAKEIEKALGSAASEDEPSSLKLRRDLAELLKSTSDLLQMTAQAIVKNLR
jgi:hypothetical protein